MKMNVIISVFLILVLGCKNENDYFSFEPKSVSSVEILPFEESGYPFNKGYRIINRNDIETIIKSINEITPFEYGTSKINHNKFLLKLIVEEEVFKYPIYFNDDLHRTSIDLFSNGRSGYFIGYYNCDGLYEKLLEIIEEG